MAKIKDIAEENHDDGDGTLDNIEQSQKIGLSEMSKEILEHILVHLDDRSLLRASHVCTKFAVVAEAAFAQKYSNKSYELIPWVEHNISVHEVMLSKYGDKIRNLEIWVREEDERWLDLAERTCCNLSSLNLHGSSKMILPTGLKEIRLPDSDHLNRASFTEFINNNQQLEILRLYDHKADLLDVLDGLNNLERLEYMCRSSFANDLPTIRLLTLETLELGLFKNTEDYARVLRAITCGDLKSLSLSGGVLQLDDLPDIVIDQICTFGTLTSVQLYAYEATGDQLKALARRLPHLTEFEMGITGNAESKIRLALRILPKLTKLTITLDDYEYRDFFDDLQKSMQNFRTRFGVTNTELELVGGIRVVLHMSTSKDRTYAFDSRTSSLNLLWTENFNEIKMREVLDGPINGLPIEDLKIINDCADATLDIPKFMHKCFKSTITLEIKSKGPITVNANATRLPTFFPRLKVLKIQSENHSAIDVVRKLDGKFCKQIEELSIDTKNVQGDGDEELEHGNDITHILAKFENLKSLHVATPAMNFDAKHLMSVCVNLKDLRVHRHSNQ